MPEFFRYSLGSGAGPCQTFVRLRASATRTPTGFVQLSKICCSWSCGRAVALWPSMPTMVSARRLPLVELAVEPGGDVLPQVSGFGAEEAEVADGGEFYLGGFELTDFLARAAVTVEQGLYRR